MRWMGTLAMASALALWGCSDDAPPTSGTAGIDGGNVGDGSGGGSGGSGGAGGVGGSGGAGGTGGQGGTGGAADPDAEDDSTVTPDGGGDEGGGPDGGGPDIPIAPGETGYPCTNNDMCFSGWCVQGPDGPICVPACDGECPNGFACKAVNDAGGDPTFICVPQTTKLCQPCEANSDCVLFGDSENRCVSFGDAGSFCGLKCFGEGSCPEGYSCTELEDGPEGTKLQCLPDAGECSCNQHGINLELATTCYATNEFGSCAGSRACADGGLEACGAPAAAEESCNGKDDDCDGETDEELEGAPCELTNEYGTCEGVLSCVGGGGVCQGDDAAPETCNGLDDDCDGETDEEDAVGCDVYYLDGDGDGVGGEVKKCLCSADPESDFDVEVGGDCNDGDASVKPGADEACNLVDDDCDGMTDEGVSVETGCTTYYFDGDGDGWGSDEAKCLCGPDEVGKFTATEKGDCADNNPAVNPGAEEVCNTIDDNCDQASDPAGSPGCQDYHWDGDNDGYGVEGNVQCLCKPEDKYTSQSAEYDCLDTNGSVFPGAIEVCDGLDNNCNGQSDEGFNDFDGDGIANCADPDNDNDGDPNETDCKEFDPEVYSFAQEICDGKDNNCDGSSDEENSPGCVPHFFDGDDDNWGVPGDQKCLCGPQGDYSTTNQPDCLDSNPLINPGAIEVCDSLDNDCDGQTDPDDAVGCQPFYFDQDKDGWGLEGDAKCLCGPAAPYSAPQAPDCDDEVQSINPNAAEACDGKDNNCNGETDEGVGGDFDGDGLGDCVDPDDDNDGDPDVTDCAPFDATVNSSATEICDTKDNNCDGTADEENAQGCQPWYFDGDSDTWGVLSNSKCLCGASGDYKTQKSQNDCNDGNSNINPAATEVCDGIDNNCDNIQDNEGAGGCQPWYVDNDGDGFGGSAQKCLCGPDAATKFTASQPNDCYDLNPDAKPGQDAFFTSHRGDGLFDYNCDGTETKQYNQTGTCAFLCDTFDDGDQGWQGSVPACGSNGQWVTGCSINPFTCGFDCCEDTEDRTQGCK